MNWRLIKHFYVVKIAIVWIVECWSRSRILILCHCGTLLSAINYIHAINHQPLGLWLHSWLVITKGKGNKNVCTCCGEYCLLCFSYFRPFCAPHAIIVRAFVLQYNICTDECFFISVIGYIKNLGYRIYTYTQYESKK